MNVLLNFLRELRVAARGLARRPWWSAAIVLVLAVGIGANLSIFAGVDAWLLRPLDLRDPQELVSLHMTRPKLGADQLAVSAPDLADWWEAQTSFSEQGTFVRERVTFHGDDHPQLLEAARISSSLFPLLGARPTAGRLFLGEEDLPGQAAHVALISEQLYRERFAAGTSILGRSVLIDGQPHEVVGLMPESFRFPEWAQVWRPLGSDPANTSRSERTLSVVARLRPGASLQSAEADLQRTATRLATQFPESNEDWTPRVIPLRRVWAPPVIDVALQATLAAALCVLLVICANVAGLVIARQVAKRRETAIRAVLGAGRWRLWSGVLLETSILAVAAGALGWLFGYLSLRDMLGRVPLDPPYLFAMSLSKTAMVFTFVVTVLCAVTSALGALGRANSPNEELKNSGARGGTRSRFRSALIIGELALSTGLVVLAMLMVKSFLLQGKVDYGYQTDNVVAIDLALGSKSSSQTQIQELESAVAALRSIPMAESLGWANSLPAGLRETSLLSIRPEGRALASGEEYWTSVSSIGEGFLETLEVKVLEGRPFTASELADPAAAAIVSNSLAEALWSTSHVVGRRFHSAKRANKNDSSGDADTSADAEDSGWYTVVGVVDDVRVGQDMVSATFIDGSIGQLYLPFRGRPYNQAVVFIRSTQPAQTVAAAAREALQRSSPEIVVAETQTLAEAVGKARWVGKFFSEQLVSYAVVAFLIAAIGLAGLMAESLAGRFREMAIRSALGADRRSLTGMLLRESMILTVPGVLAGLLGALAVSWFGAAMMVGVNPRDPQIYFGVAAALIGVTLLATWLPSRRVGRVDPATTLRSD